MPLNLPRHASDQLLPVANYNNYLNERSLGTLCHLCEKAHVPVCLISSTRRGESRPSASSSLCSTTSRNSSTTRVTASAKVPLQGFLQVGVPIAGNVRAAAHLQVQPLAAVLISEPRTGAVPVETGR